MLDKNGVEIRTGDVVEISGAFFKNDNGLWLVTHSPGDEGWSGSDHGLTKISRSGKLSTAKYRTGSWPLMVFTNDRFKRAEATAWNKEHATVEVRADALRDWSGVRAFFQREKDYAMDNAELYDRWFGSANVTSVQSRRLAAHLQAVMDRLPE